MDRPPTSRFLRDHRHEIIRLFLFERWQLEQIRLHLIQDYPEFGSHLTIHQLNGFLRAHRIYKNLSEEDVLYVKASIGPLTNTWRCLVFADGILLDNIEVEQHYRRKHECLPGSGKPKRGRNFTFIPLLFDFTVLSQPDEFRKFQRLLFYARILFESSFDSMIWRPDDRGLYARNETRIRDLKALSAVHNKVFHAITKFQAGQNEHGQALMNSTFPIHIAIVKNRHHRQFSDILAIILLIQRSGLSSFQKSVTTNLISLAGEHLLQNDPRRVMFESLDGLPLDSDGHLYLAFDHCCRNLWKSKTRTDDIKAFYSYNQASFPRADPPGLFYDFFQNKHRNEIRRVLGEADSSLSMYSHETFTIWHAALNFFHATHRYEDMEILARDLCGRVYNHRHQFDYHQAPQLNLDSMTSFYLLGEALTRRGHLTSALTALENSVELRNQLVPVEKWDAGRANVLKKLETVSKALGYQSTTNHYSSMESIMYSRVG